MPQYNITIENRIYKVELAKKDDKGLFEARVNDKPAEVTLKEGEGNSTSSLTLKIGKKSYEVELDNIDRHAPFSIRVNKALFKAQLKEPMKKTAIQTPTVRPVMAKTERRRDTVAEEGTVLAPMAGKIVALKVKKGDMVKAGDVVCILEAMKMENEITATKTGTVQEVNVSEGSPVNEGDVIAVIR